MLLIQLFLLLNENNTQLNSNRFVFSQIYREEQKKVHRIVVFGQKEGINPIRFVCCARLAMTLSDSSIPIALTPDPLFGW